MRRERNGKRSQAACRDSNRRRKGVQAERGHQAERGQRRKGVRNRRGGKGSGTVVGIPADTFLQSSNGKVPLLGGHAKKRDGRRTIDSFRRNCVRRPASGRSFEGPRLSASSATFGSHRPRLGAFAMATGGRAWVRVGRSCPATVRRLGSFGMGAARGGWVRLGRSEGEGLGSSGKIHRVRVSGLPGVAVGFVLSERPGALASFCSKADPGRRRPSDPLRQGNGRR